MTPAPQDIKKDDKTFFTADRASHERAAAAGAPRHIRRKAQAMLRKQMKDRGIRIEKGAR